ncbi:MAG TPA: hypothetical protein VHM90_06100 [Phycisphaerae bacterium]|nr:hypothetical protein [Phycisphaerae bacterium]
MLKSLAIVSVFAAAALAACNTSPRGGGMTSDDSFRVVAPENLVLHQGDAQTVKLSVARGDLFKQDVKLNLVASPGISVDPANAIIRANAGPDALVKVAVAKDAALGEYRVSVTGTPANGQPTMTDFRVKVVTP